MEKTTLSWIDYIVIAAMMSISISIGIYYRFTGGRQKTTKEYFNANKSMGTVPVGIGLMVSFVSAIAILGQSAENYTYGTQFYVFFLPALIAAPIVSYSYYPVFYKLQATSVYEYLERRFGKGARCLISLLNCVHLILYSGICLYAPSLVLEVTTGLPGFWSIIIIGIGCGFYSSIGGIKAVLITDVYQWVLMVASLVMVIATAAYQAGGLTEIWRIADDGGRIVFDRFSLSLTERHTWWNLLIAGLINQLSSTGINQIQVQRLMTVQSINAGRWALGINGILNIVFMALNSFAGLAIYSRYKDCDPKTNNQITSNDMLLPLYIMETLSHIPGLPGLFIAGIFSAALSTVSATFNSLAAITFEDYIKPLHAKYSKRKLPESKTIVIVKLLAFGFSIVCVLTAFAVQFVSSILQTSLTIFNVIAGPLLGIFTLGMLCECANETGAISGLLISVSFLVWISMGQPRPERLELPMSTERCDVNSTLNSLNHFFDNFTKTDGLIRTDSSAYEPSYFYLYRISYMWYAITGCVSSIILGLVISYCTRAISGNKGKELDPDLFFPPIARRIHRRRQKDQIEFDSTMNRAVSSVE